MSSKSLLLSAGAILVSVVTLTAAAPADAPIALRNLDHLPVPQHVIPPVCPESLGATNDRVVVVFVINDQGVPTQISATQGNHPELRAAAAAAVADWRFEPPLHGGQPCQAAARQVFVFAPDPQSDQMTAVQIPGIWGPQNSAGAPSSEQIFDISKVDKIPQASTQVRPVYPYDLRRNGIRGQVLVDFIVDTLGNVCNAYAAASTDAGFEKAAVNAVSQWKFKPGRKGERAVNVHMQVPIMFQLNVHGPATSQNPGLRPAFP